MTEDVGSTAGPKDQPDLITGSEVSASEATAASVAPNVINQSHAIAAERDVGRWPVRPAELRRVKKAVQEIHEQSDWLKVFGAGAMFLAPTFFVAWWLWPPALEALPGDSQLRYAGVGVGLLVLGFACVAVGIALLIGHVRSGGVGKATKDHAIDLIENIEDRFPDEPA